MIFLIEYVRNGSRLVAIRAFEDAQRADAESDRLALEIKNLNEGKLSEVVLLEAVSEEDLRRTHRRYFETLEELVAFPLAATLAVH